MGQIFAGSGSSLTDYSQQQFAPKWGVIYLYETIDESNIESLQGKLNHYLAYILDGQLEEEEPHKYALPKRIELIVGHKPTEVLTDFIRQLFFAPSSLIFTNYFIAC